MAVRVSLQRACAQVTVPYMSWVESLVVMVGSLPVQH